MALPSFAVLNCEKFPVISVNRSRLLAQGITAMISDFEALLRTERAFVLMMTGDRDAEPSHDDQKRWVLWLKENRDRMATTCLGVVSVKDPSADLALQEKQAAGMQGMLGIPVRIGSDPEDAERIAIELQN